MKLTAWMKKKDFRSLEEFRGKLNYSHIPDPSVYERSQFMKYFSSHALTQKIIENSQPVCSDLPGSLIC